MKWTRVLLTACHFVSASLLERGKATIRGEHYREVGVTDAVEWVRLALQRHFLRQQAGDEA